LVLSVFRARFRKIGCFIGAVCIAIGLSSSAYGGKLDEFEEDATKKRKHEEIAEEKGEREEDHSHRYGEPDTADEHESLSETVAAACMWFFLYSTVYGGASSWKRIRPSSQIQMGGAPAARSLGEALIPFARLGVSYQDVESDVTAWDFRAEAGYGPFGVQVRQTRYDETEPADNLTITQMHGLYRMSFGSRFEVDIGMGVFVLDGNETNSSFSLTTPLLFHPTEFFGVEFRPAWTSVNGSSIGDYDLSILAGWQYVSLRAGYRWLRSEDESLDGPHMGLSIRF
jgi:hypothetical protein